MVAITTYAAFVDALRDLSITGVTRQYEEPPTKLNTADLPASWPQRVRGVETMMTSKTAGGWATLTCELVVATEAVAQNTQPNNYSDMLTMMDNLSTALRGSIGTIGRSKVEWDISEDGGERIRVGGVAYWGVVATVTAY